jgi:hypothetical protein
VIRDLCEEELRLKEVQKYLPFMAPPSSSGGRKRKRGRRNWEEGGSGAPGVCEPMHQARGSQREETHGPGTHFVLYLI